MRPDKKTRQLLNSGYGAAGSGSKIVLTSDGAIQNSQLLPLFYNCIKEHLGTARETVKAAIEFGFECDRHLAVHQPFDYHPDDITAIAIKGKGLPEGRLHTGKLELSEDIRREIERIIIDKNREVNAEVERWKEKGINFDF